MENTASGWQLPDIPYLKFGEDITLTNCDREPIHIPGHAQAHGVVIALDPSSAGPDILQVSENIGELCGVSAEALLGKNIDQVLDQGAAQAVRDALADGAFKEAPVYLSTSSVQGQRPFHITAHEHDAVLVLEMELVTEPPLIVDRLTALKPAFARLRKLISLPAYMHAVCAEIQAISGFDRVMVYRFHDDGHGEVIAEVIGERDQREPYLGLHYPESDIPKQARALYMLNSIRLMPDAAYAPSPIVPAINPITNRPLDMTHCILRGYSKMYTQYLINMGATASMSLAIIKDGELWGLIACHHQTPRWVPHDIRTACEFVANIVSLQIRDKEEKELSEYREKTLSIYAGLVDSLARSQTILEGLAPHTERVDMDDAAPASLTAMDLVSSTGCAIISAGECRLLGKTPPKTWIMDLIGWLNEHRSAGSDNSGVWYTDTLTAEYPAASKYVDIAAGLLSVNVTTAAPPKSEGDYVLWFRPEVAQTVNWGGSPAKPYNIGETGEPLTPRTSFSLWQETVSGRSLRWEAVEIDAARRLRSAIAEIIVRRSTELVRVNRALMRSNVELDSFAYVASHDLKEPLRGISNLVSFLREDYADILPEEARQQMDTMMRLTRRMDNLLNTLLHYSRLGRQTLALMHVNVKDIVAETIETLKARLEETGTTVRVTSLPASLYCDPVQIGEVFENLVSNAVKYNDRPVGERWIEIGSIPSHTTSQGKDHPSQEGLSMPLQSDTIYIRDNGIGVPEEHYDAIFRIFKRLHDRDSYGGGTGAGLTIVRTIIERHLGIIWLESKTGEGTTFYFNLWSAQEEGL